MVGLFSSGAGLSKDGGGEGGANIAGLGCVGATRLGGFGSEGLSTESEGRERGKALRCTTMGRREHRSGAVSVAEGVQDGGCGTVKAPWCLSPTWDSFLKCASATLLQLYRIGICGQPQPSALRPSSGLQTFSCLPDNTSTTHPPARPSDCSTHIFPADAPLRNALHCSRRLFVAAERRFLTIFGRAVLTLQVKWTSVDPFLHLTINLTIVSLLFL